ncbi:putative oxidoreductase CatD [Paenibacillus sp. J45TS6]|uniref:DoxX family protein n=1 Tax=Paenibacillus sp. J45TS6 TaxID=2807196 RepID=UPI001B06FA1E|nr:DoxX family protein [Paenibacillus sp. J45TS6]GIP42256.1 putative oxidoreductase CatD [Paenibacillus sp. J45TS6]
MYSNRNQSQTRNMELGLLITRLVLGAIFLIHGITKFQGMEDTQSYFISLGLPGSMATIVGLVEFFGGVFLIIGLFTRIVSLLFVAILFVAIFTAKAESGFIGGYELDVALIGMGITLAVAGSRYVAVDRLFRRNRR